VPAGPESAGVSAQPGAVSGENRGVHVPDGFLSAPVAASTWAGAVGTLAWALRAERRLPERAPAGTLGALAAFVFAGQLVNLPVLPGTSGHLVGGTLAAAIVGPWRGLIVMAVVLAVQALLFQDGGITTFGANLLAMGFAGAVGGYAVTALVARLRPGVRGLVAGSVIGAFVAMLAGAGFVALALAASGLYPAAIVLPVMLSLHVPIALVEAALTGAILATVVRWRPDIVRGLQAARSGAAPAVGLLVVALAIAAFAAPFASPLPDALEAVAHRLGFAAAARGLWPAPAPDYALPWLAAGRASAAITGLVGSLVAAALAWAVTRRLGTARAAEPHA
jgi:cobalt/nickel transport system permease protein